MQDNDINLPEDRTYTATVNEQSIIANNKESAQGGNTRSINESGMVQDGELPKNNAEINTKNGIETPTY